MVRRRVARPAVIALTALLGLGAVVAVLDDGDPGDEQATLQSATDSDSGAGAGAAPSAPLPYGMEGGTTFSGANGSAPAAAGRAIGDYDEQAASSLYESAPGEAASTAGAPPVSPVVGPTELGGPPVPEAVATGNSRVIKTASVSLSVGKGKLSGAHQSALEAVSTAGGWVQSSQTADDQASYVLKVPGDKLDGVMGQLRKLGDVRSESIQGQDVSAEYVDLEARLRHWRAQEAVFVELMGKAKTIGETIQIQQQLSSVQQQIEQLEGRRRFLEGQTAYSTINLSVLVDGAVAKVDTEPASPTTLARAWDRAAGATLAVLGGTLVVLGVVVPLALVLGVPALILLSVRRRRSPAPVAP